MRLAAALLALSLLSLASPARAGYQGGMEAFRSGDFGRAASELENEVQRHPRFAYAHYMLGVCRMAQNEHRRALPSLRKAAELEPDRLEYHAGIARAHAELGEWDGVAQALEGRTGLDAAPGESARARFLLGLALLNLKRYSAAARELAAARDIEPGSFKALSALGIALFMAGDPGAAIDPLAAALKRDPEQVEIRRYLAEAQLSAAQRASEPAGREALYASALQNAAQVLQARGPGEFEAVYLLSRAQLGAGRFREAVEGFDRAIALEPARAQTHFNRGQALKGLGEWSRAAQSYRSAAELQPDNAVALAALGYVYERLAEQDGGASLDRALSAYQKSLAIEPSDSTRHAIGRVRDNIRVRDGGAAGSARNPEK